MKPIPGYEGIYSITEDGQVFSHKRAKGSIGCGGKGGFLKGCPDKDGYLKVTLHKDGIQKTPKVHTLMALTYLGGAVADHIDRNPANNQLSNLRPCSLSQNRANAKINSNNTSGYKGVCWCKGRKRWKALIQFNKKPIGLGLFKEKTDAARAYDEAAIRLFGVFACINFPLAQEPRKSG